MGVPRQLNIYTPFQYAHWSIATEVNSVPLSTRMQQDAPRCRIERREVCTSDSFYCQVLLPADSAALVCLDEIK
jgi:hypothetical protein